MAGCSPFGNFCPSRSLIPTQDDELVVKPSPSHLGEKTVKGAHTGIDNCHIYVEGGSAVPSPTKSPAFVFRCSHPHVGAHHEPPVLLPVPHLHPSVRTSFLFSSKSSVSSDNTDCCNSSSLNQLFQFSPHQSPQFLPRQEQMA